MNKKNVWFTVSGVLSIVASVGLLLAIVIMAATFAGIELGQFEIRDEFGNVLTAAQLEMVKQVCAIIIVVCVVFLALSIFQAVVYLKFASKSKEEVKSHSGLVITTIVFSFLTAGVLTGVFGILGYLKDEWQTSSTSKPIDVQPANGDKYAQVKADLENLENLKNSGILSEEEYKQKRQDIINKM